MKKIMYVFPLALILGCGDKDEDTGSDTATVEDSTDTARVHSEIGASHSLHTHTKENKMSDNNKSGYQLRTDLLGMAMGIVVDRTNRLEAE
jgi:hypothetical protein